MWVRGAPLIGATAAFGVSEEMKRDPSDASLNKAWDELHETRPTAINLRWALDEMRALLKNTPSAERAAVAHKRALEISDEDVYTIKMELAMDYLMEYRQFKNEPEN
jgi:methylthioribose-1-phosphate isomerase